MKTQQDENIAQMKREFDDAVDAFDIDRVFSISREILSENAEPDSDLENRVAQFIKDLTSIGITGRNPGEQSYFEIRDMVFPEKRGLDKERYRKLKKAKTLYWYRESLKYGDLKFADWYLQRYLQFPNPINGPLVKNLYLTHPLSGISTIKRYRFKQSLTPSQKATLDRAMEWYRQTYLEKHRGNNQ